MDIDSNFIKGLVIPENEMATGRKMENIDVELPDEEEDFSSESVSETAERSAEIVPETEKSTEQEEQEIRTPDIFLSEKTFETISSIEKNVQAVIEKIAEMESYVHKFDGYDKAVDTLRRSLAANQRNEENIYKELEVYKRNQYYNYIKPFIEFLINILTDMVSSRKQYENDAVEFIASHGQEVYDEIIEIYDYYIQQIESQLQIQGVEILRYEPETPFVSTEQTISKTIFTESPEKTGLVGKVISDCYKFDDKVIKKAKVQVYKSKPVNNK